MRAHSLDGWRVLPVVATAQGKYVKPDPGEAGNGWRMQRWILKGAKPSSSVQPPVQER